MKNKITQINATINDYNGYGDTGKNVFQEPENVNNALMCTVYLTGERLPIGKDYANKY